MKIIDKDNYHGISIRVNNSRSCSKIRVNRRDRFIEFNYNFMNRLKESQQVFLFEWARFNLRRKDVYWCDKKALARCLALGYNQVEIMDLLNTIGFSNNDQKKKRVFYLVTEDQREYEIKQFIKVLFNPLKWFRKK